jgi:hypothetical protein
MLDGASLSVPVDWTDFNNPDPELVIGKRRSRFRIKDLLELVQFLEILGGVKKERKL